MPLCACTVVDSALGHLGCFQSFAVTAVMNNFSSVSFCTYARLSPK